MIGAFALALIQLVGVAAAEGPHAIRLEGVQGHPRLTDIYGQIEVRCLRWTTSQANTEAGFMNIVFWPEGKPVKSAPDDWPAPGSEDTELGVLMELEVGHGEASVYAGVQA